MMGWIRDFCFRDVVELPIARLFGFLMVTATLFSPASARAQLEQLLAVGACLPAALSNPSEFAHVSDAIEAAKSSADLARHASVFVDTIVPWATHNCPGEPADALREIGIELLYVAGSTQQMRDAAQSFLDDLGRRGLGESARAARLFHLLAREAELGGRIPDSLADARHAASILEHVDDPDTRKQNDLHLACLARAVAAGSVTCTADEESAGPYGIFPAVAFCDRNSQLVLDGNAIWAAAQYPSNRAFTDFCAAEVRMRTEMARLNQPDVMPDAVIPGILDALLAMAPPIAVLFPGNAVARAQPTNLAAAFAFSQAVAALGRGETSTGAALMTRARAIAGDSVAVRAEAAKQLAAGLKGVLPIEPWGPHLLGLLLEPASGGDSAVRQAFKVMAAARYDATSLAVRTVYAGSGQRPAGDFGAAQAALRPGEALLAIHATPGGTSTGLLIRRERGIIFPILMTQRELAAAVSAYRAITDVRPSGAAPFDPAPAAHLHDALFWQLMQTGLLTGVTDLFIVPDRTTEAMPFGALVTGIDGRATPNPGSTWDPVESADLDRVRFLGERFAISLLPGLDDLAALRAAPKLAVVQPYLGLGDPVGPYIGHHPGQWSLSDISATAAQMHDTADRFGGRPDLVLTGAQATLPALRAALAQGPFQVVELATHGVGERPTGAPDAVPPGPWLALSAAPGQSSFLTLDELRGLRVETNLVILSACVSAAPAGSAGEGLLSGLARGFLAAGARSLIVSLWDIPYPSGTRMLQVATGVLADKPGTSASAALRKARVAVFDRRENRLFHHPYYWAGLIAIGPRPGL